MGKHVNVIGVGMTKFQKPGASDDYQVLGATAIRAALKDAGVAFEEVQAAFAGYVYGDSTCGQQAVYSVGTTGIPVVNVHNNCSTGSSALMLARQMIEGGLYECVLAVGFEQMGKGALELKWDDRPAPLQRQAELMHELQGIVAAPAAAQLFGGAGREYRWRHGTKRETFARIAEKARRHASRNPLAKHHVIASLLAIATQARACEPDQGVEPEDGANRFSRDLNCPVVAPDMRQFVSQHNADAVARPVADVCG